MDFWIWAILLLVLGTGLAVMEVFFPSAGILGFLSAVAAAGGRRDGLLPRTRGGNPHPAGGRGRPADRDRAGLQVLAENRDGARVLLMAPTSEDVLPDDPEKDCLKGLVGRTGRAKSKMLLSGVITIDGRTVDAVSESMPIEVGQAVRVVQVRGHGVVVRPIDEESAAAPPADPLQRTFDDPFDLPPA